MNGRKKELFLNAVRSRVRTSQKFSQIGTKADTKAPSQTTSTVSLPFSLLAYERKLCGRVFVSVSVSNILLTLYWILDNTAYNCIKFLAMSLRQVKQILSSSFESCLCDQQDQKRIFVHCAKETVMQRKWKKERGKVFRRMFDIMESGSECETENYTFLFSWCLLLLVMTYNG